MRGTVFGFSLLAVISLSFAAFAQEIAGPNHHQRFDLPNWKAEATDTRLEFQTYRTSVLNDTALSIEEKVELIIARRDLIETNFREQRRSLYSRYRSQLGVGHSCTKANSGGTKKCGQKCATIDNADLYTKVEWVKSWSRDTRRPASSLTSTPPRGDGTGKISANGQTICTSSLRKSGKGRKAAYTLGIFRIRPTSVAKFVGEETAAFLDYVVSSPT